MNKTYSQEIAHSFEVINYFLLVPATCGVLLSIVSFAFGATPLNLIVIAVYLYGCSLQRDYYLHSRDRLHRQSIAKMWSRTVIYNGVLTVITLPIMVISLFGGSILGFLCSAWFLICQSLAIYHFVHFLRDDKTAKLKFKNSENAR